MVREMGGGQVRKEGEQGGWRMAAFDGESGGYWGRWRRVEMRGAGER